MKKLVAFIFFIFCVVVNYAQNTNLNFDGTDDAITLGDINELDGTSTFTIETWAKFTSSGSTGNQLFSKFLDNDNNIQLLPRTNDILISVENGSSNFATLNHTNLGTWQHYALVFDGTQTGNVNRLKLYINGVEQTLSFIGTVPATTDDNSIDVLIGAGVSALNQFAGNLDEYRIWSVARSQSEIANNRFNTLIAANETNLISYYQFEHVDGTTTIIDEKLAYNGTWSGNSGTNTTSNFETGQDPLPSENNIYWTDGVLNRIQRMDSLGDNAELIHFNLHSTSGVAVDGVNGKMYWTDTNRDRIFRMNLDGTFVEDLIITSNKVIDIALDVANFKMYWTDSNNGNIYRADMDGSNNQTIITGMSSPSGIDVDVTNGKIYFCEGGTGKIRKANLDGSTVQTVLSGQTTVNGIEVDEVNGKIYWTDIGLNTIKRANTNGSSIQTLLSSNKPTRITLDVTNNKMFWSEDGTDKIRSANLDGTSTVDLVTTSLSQPHGIAFNSTNGKLYYADRTLGKLEQVDTDGSNRITIKSQNNTNPLGMTIDFINDKLYWADQSNAKIIRSDLNGAQKEELITTGLSEPIDIAVDAVNNLMYWTDKTSGKIQKSALDGSNITDIVTGLTDPMGITLDFVNEKVYWTDQGSDKIQRANLDGSNVENLVATGLSNPYDIALDLFNQHIYWTDASTNKIQRSNLDGTSVTDISTGLNSPLSVALDIPHHRIYWTEDGSDKIRKSFLDGTGKTDILTENINNPRNVTLTYGCNALASSFSTNISTLGVATTFTDASVNVSGSATYEWDFDNDGSVDATTVGNASYTYPVAGIYTAKLTITDGSCISAATQTVYISGGYSLHFDGTDDYVQMSNNLSAIGTSSSTIEMWMKAPSVGNGGLASGERVGALIGNYDAAKNFNYEISENGIFRLFWNNAQINVFGTTDLRDDTWHHIAVVRDKSQGKFFVYIDGDLELTHNSAGSDIALSTAHRIGGDVRDAAGGHSFHGYMDDIRIWTTARSQSEIQDNQNIELVGNEANLEHYYKFDNNNSGCDIQDCNSNENIGTRTGSSGTNNLPQFSTDIPQTGDATCGICLSCDFTIAFSADIVAVGAATTFTDASTNVPTSSTYEWDFDNDGSVDATTVGNASHIYPSFGTFTAALKITTPEGCEQSTTISVTVNCATPVPAFIVSNAIQGTATTFTDVSTNLTGSATYAWDFDNDGSTDATTVGDVTYTYPAGGTYTAKLTITNGSCSASATEAVTVCNINADFTTLTVEEGVATPFTDASTNITGSAVYEWDFDNDGTNDDYTVGNALNTYPSVGTYSAKLTITDSQGCTDDVTKSVAVDAPIVEAELYWTDETLNVIQKIDSVGNERAMLHFTTAEPKGVTIDETNEKIYWTDATEDKIFRSNYDGSFVEDIVSTTSQPEGITLDVPNNKMYWTDSQSGKIHKADLNGSNEQVIVTGLTAPLDIDIHLSSNKIYFCESGAIKRIDLDGSNLTAIISAGLTTPAGIAVDETNNKLYWTDIGSDKIQRANMDGSSVQTIVATANTSNGIALDITNSKIYWTEDATNKIRSANLDGSSSADFMTTDLVEPHGIVFNTTNSKLIWTDKSEEKIEEAKPDGSLRIELITTSSTNPLGIAIDYVNDKMYWVDRNNAKIIRSDLDGTLKEEIITTGLNEPIDIALDVPNNLMYWTERGNDKIQKSDLYGNSIQDVVTGLTDPMGLVLDAANGKIYWTDQTANKIQRANVDGTSVEDLVTTGLSSPTDIDIDHTKGRIYWTNTNNNKIQRADLDGSNVTDLITTGLSSPLAITLDIINGRMYWTEDGSNKIRKANLTGSSVSDVFTTNISTPSGIALNYGCAQLIASFTADQVSEGTPTSFTDASNTISNSATYAWDFDNDASTDATTVGDVTHTYSTDGNYTATLTVTDGVCVSKAIVNIIVDEVVGALDPEGIFWTDYNARTITKATADGSSQEELLNGKSYIPAVAVDATNGKIYWTDTDKDKIMRSNLDGTNTEDLVTTGLSYVLGITLDVPNGKMYWTDAGTDKIQRANLDGTTVEDLVTTGLSHPNSIAIDATNSKMYWTDGYADKIQRANLDGSNVEDLTSRDRLNSVQLDVANNKMYYTYSYYTTYTYSHGGWLSSHTHTSYRYYYAIASANLDGSNHTVQVNTGRPSHVRLDLANNKMYWADYNQKIYRSNLNGSTIEYLVTSNSGNISNVAFDAANNKMYWSNTTYDKIQVANLDGTNIQDIQNTNIISTVPYGIDLDIANNKMYWTSDNKIQKANVDGTNPEDVLTTGLSCARGITLDLTNNKMYWTDLCTDKIQRANLDGSNVEDLVTTGLSYAIGIALDVPNNKMYWVDYHTDKVQRANLDGSNIEDLVTGLSDPWGIDLDLTKNKMYWTSRIGRKIKRANLDGSNVEDLISTGLSAPQGIALDVPNGKMYWNDGSTRKIQKANLDGSNVEDVITTGISYNTYDIAINIPLSPALPVELAYFDATAQDNKTAFLEWETASEQNNEGFIIERSSNGLDWEELGFVIGQGTTTHNTAYDFTDENPFDGINYYRLKQVDFDGTTSYSDIRTVYFGDGTAKKEIVVYPNPFNNYLNIENGQGQATIFNQQGQVMQSIEINESRFQLNVSDWAKGLYYFRVVQTDGTVKTVKVVKF